MQESIVLTIRPDEFILESNARRGTTEQIDPSQFTNRIPFLYNFAYRIFGENSAILNFRMWRSIIFINILLVTLAVFLRKKLSFIPSKAQIVFELIYDFIKGLVVDVLGGQNIRFLPYFLTLFLFILISNWSGLLPIPDLVEPTRHLNVTLGLGVMSLSIVHYNAMKKKGFTNYIKGYCEPMFILAPINVVGELAKVVSISFRLFGNIFGGAIIFAVVASLTRFVVVPIGLNVFFVMFAGTLQAFVFTMLSMTYLALEITD
jgi:F-type H+-transporting ATPase subunit a